MTESKSLQTYKTAELAKIKKDVESARTPYELVRMENLIIAKNEHREIIAEMLLELNEFTNVTRKMNGGQIVETVKMLLQNYPNLSLQEYQAFFDRIRAGYYGQLYESLDGIKIMAFMKEFYEELNKAWNEKIYEADYHRKAETGARDLNTWTEGN